MAPHIDWLNNTALVAAREPDGRFFRHLFPMALLLLIFLDLLIGWGARQGYYGEGKVLPMVIGVNGVLLLVLFWRFSAMLIKGKNNDKKNMHKKSDGAIEKGQSWLNIVSNCTMAPIFVKDREGRMTFANPAALRVIGKNNASVVGLKSDEIFSNRDDSALMNLHDQLVINSGKPLVFEETVRSTNGHRIFQVTKSPWKNDRGEIAGIVGVATDITERKRVEDALKVHEMQLEEIVVARTAEVRELIAHLESTREEEKRALARELHDDLGASLTALNMHLAIVFQKISSDAGLSERAAKVRELLASITATTRRIQSGLRPDKLDILGIKAAIAEQVTDLENCAGIKCRANLPDEDVAYNAQLEITLFRMTQEALNNIVKHAKATTAEVILDDNDEYVTLTIRDDGVGMPRQRSPRNTHGLRGMRERASYLGGRIEIVSAEYQGTKIIITLPKTLRQELVEG